MDKQKLKKILRYSYWGLLTIYIIVMLLMCAVANGRVEEATALSTAENPPQFATLSAIQHPVSVVNIISFMLMLGLSLWMQYNSSRKILTYLPLAVFAIFTLYSYISLPGLFFSMGGNNASLSGQYWLMFFIGLFFVAGAISVTVIGNIAMRNITNRQKAKENE